MISPLLQDKLSILASDSLMIDAIRAIIEERMNELLPSTEYGMTNEVIGQNYRSFSVAREMFRIILTDIQSYKKEVVSSNQVNKAR